MGKKKLKKSGPCLLCLEPDVQYGDPNRFHKKQGDKWLTKMERRHEREGGLLVFMKNKYLIKIAGYRFNDIKFYLCDRCFNDPLRRMPVASDTPVIISEEKKRLTEIALNKNNEPEDRFSALLKLVDSTEKNNLKKMRYSDYLKTHYWGIIRNYLFCIKGQMCPFCGGNAFIIHHADYKYRNAGVDHEYLENLYPICDNCHKTIHDKSKIDIGDGNIIFLGDININNFWALFIADEKESHVRKKYIETKQKDYLKESRFLDFIIENRHLSGSNFYRQFNPR